MALAVRPAKVPIAINELDFKTCPKTLPAELPGRTSAAITVSVVCKFVRP